MREIQETCRISGGCCCVVFWTTEICRRGEGEARKVTQFCRKGTCVEIWTMLDLFLDKRSRLFISKWSNLSASGLHTLLAQKAPCTICKLCETPSLQWWGGWACGLSRCAGTW